MEFTLKQAQLLVEAFGGDEESTLTVVATPTINGEALCAFATDYPEEGSFFLGATE